uniref:START domain-containing protein n=1 Tax=Globisporangium ultimum (strain ATCC 200006 / CBS 805.95 / DAOM BR144) TaxID=431595 RepID=K3WDN9_GLOUD
MERKKESITRVKKAVAELESQVRLLKLTSEKVTLEQENDLLQHHLTGESTNANNLEQLKALLEVRKRCNRQDGWQSNAAEKKLVESSFEPVTPQRWRELVDKTMKETDAQACDPSFRSMGFSVLGWSDRRKIEDATVKFTFSKFFPHIWAEELLNRTWDKVTTESYSSFFSPSLYITRVSNDAIIVYRAICNPHTNRISRSVELIGRIRRERDFVLFIRSFDGAHNVHRCVGEAQSWSRSMTILRFEPTSMHQTSPGCMMHFGGAYANLATAGVQHWLMEVLFIVLRFESVMIAPMFAICAS